jgi:exportin-T
MAAAGALRRIVSKGLKEPADKLQLIKVLSLGQVISSLEERTRAEQIARGDDTDEGEESYRETLGRLLNVLGLELVKLADVSCSLSHYSIISSAPKDAPADEVRAEGSGLLQQILPIMLRFMEDEYDDTCSTVFPMLQTVLASVCPNLYFHMTPAEITGSTSGTENFQQSPSTNKDEHFLPRCRLLSSKK